MNDKGVHLFDEVLQSFNENLKILKSSTKRVETLVKFCFFLNPSTQADVLEDFLNAFQTEIENSRVLGHTLGTFFNRSAL